MSLLRLYFENIKIKLSDDLIKIYSTEKKRQKLFTSLRVKDVSRQIFTQ